MKNSKVYCTIISVCCWASLSVGDDWDPVDNVGAGATVLTASELTQAHGEHALGISDTNDWFKVSLIAGTLLSVQSTGSSDLFGHLYNDASGSVEIAFNDDGGEGNNFRIDYMPTADGDYFLKVHALPEGVNVNYSLKYIVLPPVDSWDPGDDSGAGATDLAIDLMLRQSGPHVLGASDVSDWFKFSLVAGELYRFESSGDWDPLGFLYTDSAGTNEVATDDDSGSGEFDFRIDYTPGVSGDYFLKVVSAIGTDPVSYTLEYRSGDAADSDWDGMKDDWEIQYFGSINSMPNAHGDSDIQNNLEEYIAGTDPTNSASFFAVTNGSVGSFIVEWSAVPSREYQVLWAEGLTNSFQQVGPVIEHPQNSYTDTVHSAESSGFYKVEVQLK